MTPKTIVYVGNRDTNFIKIPTFSEMFNFLNSKIKIELLIIDVDMFDFIDIYGIISSIFILRKTHLLNFKVACLVSESSNQTTVKQIISVGVDGLIPCQTWLGKEKEKLAIDSILSNNPIKHKIILDQLTKKEVKNNFELTPRQDQICNLICNRGITNKAIARALNISESTVKLHVTGILKKIGAKNRAQIIVSTKK